jgi:hypothetical protein
VNIGNHEATHKSLNENIEDMEHISHSDIYDTIDKYYKSKNGSYQFAIGVVCHTNKSISDNLIQKEIKRLSSNINNSNFSDDDRTRFRYMIKFYKNIMRFCDYYSDKGSKISTNDVFNIFKKVQQKNVQESNEEHENEIFDNLKLRVNEQDSQYDIIKKFIIYNTEKGNIDILVERCILDLPDVLSRFGFSNQKYTDDLHKMVIQVLEELNTEAHGSIIESSLENVSIKNNGRNNISSQTKREVWRRDQGKCSKCGSRKNLEYDHIIPVSKGGSCTIRNIELLCQECNRKKTNKIL